MHPLEYAKKICYSSEETLKFTFKIAQQYNQEGNILVECGCAAGAQIIALLYGAPKARVWAFDSFQGIPLPSNRDDQMPGISLLSAIEQKILPDPGKQALISSGATVVSEKDFRDHIKNSGVYAGKLEVFKGWFEEVFADGFAWNFRPIDIHVLRLDGDLYNSTWVCLQHLFPKVVKGGCVIIDDIELKGCRDACDEYFKLIGYEPKYEYVSNIAYFYK